MSKYQEFDSEIFDITRIIVGLSLTDGQKEELLKVSGKIDAAFRDGSLTAAERQQLRLTMADCGLELPPDAAGQTKPPRKKQKTNGRDR